MSRLGTRVLLWSALVATLVAVPAPALAHGVGVRGDLPLPVSLVAWGATGVLLFSFLALSLLWPRPRLETAGPGLAAPSWLSQLAGVLVWPARFLGVVTLGFLLYAGLAGPRGQDVNVLPYAVYVAIWVGGMFASGLVGDVWRAFNPFAALADGLESFLGDSGPAWLDRVGQWPAAALLFAFAWLELVHPDPANPRVLGIALAVYTGVLVLGGVWWGPRWVRNADAFGAFFSLLAAMAPLSRDTDGTLRLRWPLTGLARLRARPGTAALVLVALGSTTFDGVTRLSAWEDIVDGAGWDTVPVATLGLALTTAAVAGLYLAAMWVAARYVEGDATDLARAFAHSLIPIALGYAVAHYFSLLVFEGQTFLALASDPLNRGWNLFGTAQWSVDFRAVSPTTIAWVQAGGIVLGHVAGVVLAHDRAVARLPQEQAVRSQYALLVVMIGYTVGGLLLLLGT